jgi:hypothetical protein
VIYEFNYQSEMTGNTILVAGDDNSTIAWNGVYNYHIFRQTQIKPTKNEIWRFPKNYGNIPNHPSH